MRRVLSVFAVRARRVVLSVFVAFAVFASVLGSAIPAAQARGVGGDGSVGLGMGGALDGPQLGSAVSGAERAHRGVASVVVTQAGAAGVSEVGPVGRVAQVGGFGDVDDGAFYSDAVSALADLGVFEGTLCDAGFCPGDVIDRKTMAVWTVRVVTGGDPAAVDHTRFDDVDPASFYARFIEEMADLEITLGCGDGSGFCPGRSVNRSHMAVFLSRAFGLPDGPDPGFGDVADDAWYAPDVARLAASGITHGCGDRRSFCPGRATTRAEMAAFLYRGLGWVADREAAAVAASRVELSAVPGEAFVTPHRGRVFVSWPATQPLPGSPVAGYEVQWRAGGETWDTTRRAVVVGLSYEVRGLSGGVHEIRVRRAVVERAQAGGASIVSAQGTAPTAELVEPAVAIDDAGNVSAFDGVVDFEMTGQPVWPATIEIPVVMDEIEHDDFVFLMSFNEEHQIWLPEPGAVLDTDRGVVTAEVYHLSNWFIRRVKVIESEIEQAARNVGVVVETVGRVTVDTAADVTEMVVEPVVNTVDRGVDKARAVTRYVYDTTSDGVVYVWEKGRVYAVNTYITARRQALEAARAAWEATKAAVAMRWDEFVEVVEHLADRLTLTRPACSDTEPGWVRSLDTPAPGAPLIVCPEAVGPQDQRDLRLKVTSWRYYPMLLTARGATGHTIRIATENDDIDRIRIENTEGTSPLGDEIVGWLNNAIDTGEVVLPAGATHWLRIPRSNFGNRTSMTLEGTFDGYAASVGTFVLAIDVLLEVFGISLGSGDIALLEDLSDEADTCFSHNYTTASTDEERFRSFINTTTCLTDVYHQTGVSKAIGVLIGPVALLVETSAQLVGYTEALNDKITGNHTPITTIRVTPAGDNTQPDPESTPTTFKAIAAGGWHSCAITLADDIECWGSNTVGQSDTPAGKYQTIAARGHRSCAITLEGEIECWGWKSRGQSKAPPSGTYQAIAAGADHTCAITHEGNVECWGQNNFGQTVVPSSGKYKAIAAGGSHTCAIRLDGDVDCWGQNHLLRNRSRLGNYQAIAAGFDGHTCAITHEGDVDCWGSNDRGQSDDPAGKYQAIAAGWDHTCAITHEGDIECWGSNAEGQSEAPSSGKYQAIAAGRDHTCAITHDGDIECWGSNDHGQLFR